MIDSKTVHQTPLGRSLLLIEAILEDVVSTYTHSGGGGITSIKETATNVYAIEISQEERVDVITYEGDVSLDGIVVILNRDEGVKNS